MEGASSRTGGRRINLGVLTLSGGFTSPFALQHCGVSAVCYLRISSDTTLDHQPSKVSISFRFSRWRSWPQCARERQNTTFPSVNRTQDPDSWFSSNLWSRGAPTVAGKGTADGALFAPTCSTGSAVGGPAPPESGSVAFGSTTRWTLPHAR